MKWTNLLPALGCVVGAFLLGYVVDRRHFGPVLLGYGLFFISYFLIIRREHGRRQLYWWLALAIGLRLLLVFAMPRLSDDVYRFIWDGRLLVNGHHPFDHLPAWYLSPEAPDIPGIDRSLFEQLNSPEYYTIYPPVAQAVFGLACWLFPTSLYGGILVMKLFLLAGDILSLLLLTRLLRAWDLPPDRILLYALNPLIIVEICGNLHFEGIMIALLLLALWWLHRRRWLASAGSMALSVATKLLPLLFLPFMIIRLGWRRSLLYFGLFGLLCLGLFFPLLNGYFLQNFGESLDLYFRKFEFNASLYYLLRWVGFQKYGYNLIETIGPRLGVLVFAAVMLFAALDGDRSLRQLPGRWLYAITAYLLCTTIVHPWYLCLPVVLCLFTNWRYPILWSALATLTYSTYSTQPYREQLWIVGLEYTLVVGFMLWEFRREVWRPLYQE